MKIHNILTSLRENKGGEKVASAAPVATPAATAPQAALKTALDSALANEKTASATSSNPITDVAKIASEIRAAEDEVGVKRASLLGKAWAQAAIAEFQGWQKTAAQVAPAAAAAAPTAASGIRGYAETKQAMEKAAEEAYVQGYNDTVNKIHDIAANEFVKGAAVVGWILDCQAQG